MSGGEAGFWDARYAADGYLFGTEPNGFLVAEAGRIAPGADILCVADGEGRNGVWLAAQGHRVHAVEASAPALAKARALAEARGVPIASAPFADDHRPGTIAFEPADLLGWPWPEGRYGAVVAIFIQFAAPAERARIFDGMARALAPGGVLLLEGYGPRQLEYGTGGPRALDHLYTPELLRSAFPDLMTVVLEEEDREVHEGPGHDGMSALIHFAAVAPDARPEA